MGIQPTQQKEKNRLGRKNGTQLEEPTEAGERTIKPRAVGPGRSEYDGVYGRIGDAASPARDRRGARLSTPPENTTYERSRDRGARLSPSSFFAPRGGKAPNAPDVKTAGRRRRAEGTGQTKKTVQTQLLGDLPLYLPPLFLARLLPQSLLIHQLLSEIVFLLITSIVLAVQDLISPLPLLLIVRPPSPHSVSFQPDRQPISSLRLHHTALSLYFSCAASP